MLTFGLGGSNHDYAACLVEDDEIVCGLEEERLTRRKYSVGVNSLFNGSALRNGFLWTYRAWMVNQFLHGKLLTVARLVEIVPDITTKMYATLQIADKAWHVGTRVSRSLRSQRAAARSWG
jgi:predicted NodU family carbamoyl transferase